MTHDPRTREAASEIQRSQRQRRPRAEGGNSAGKITLFLRAGEAIIGKTSH